MKMIGLTVLMSIVAVGAVVGADAEPVNCFLHWGRGIESYRDFATYGAIYRQCREIPGWDELTAKLQCIAAIIGRRSGESAVSTQMHNTLAPIEKIMSANHALFKGKNKPRIKRWLLSFRLTDIVVQALARAEGLDEASFASTLHARYLLLETEMTIWATKKNGLSPAEIVFLQGQSRTFIDSVDHKAGTAAAVGKCMEASEKAEEALLSEFNSRFGLK